MFLVPCAPVFVSVLITAGRERACASLEEPRRGNLKVEDVIPREIGGRGRVREFGEEAGLK